MQGRKTHLDKDLHTTAKTQHQVQGRLFLNVVVAQGPAILQLLSGEDESLLVRGNALLVLNLGLDVVNGVGALDLESDCLSGEGLRESSRPVSPPESDPFCSGQLIARDVAAAPLQRSAFLLGDGGRGGGCSPSGCCNR